MSLALSFHKKKSIDCARYWFTWSMDAISMSFLSDHVPVSNYKVYCTCIGGHKKRENSSTWYINNFDSPCPVAACPIMRVENLSRQIWEKRKIVFILAITTTTTTRTRRVRCSSTWWQEGWRALLPNSTLRVFLIIFQLLDDDDAPVQSHSLWAATVVAATVNVVTKSHLIKKSG